MRIGNAILFFSSVFFQKRQKHFPSDNHERDAQRYLVAVIGTQDIHGSLQQGLPLAERRQAHGGGASTAGRWHALHRRRPSAPMYGFDERSQSQKVIRLVLVASSLCNVVSQ